MKLSTVVRPVVVLIVLTFAWQAYRCRVRVETWVWHLRHGQSLVFADYVVPVPRNWSVDDAGAQSHALIRLDTEDRAGDPERDRRLRFHAIITLSARTTALTQEKLNTLTAFKVAALKKDGIDAVLRTYDFDGESLTCVGGSTFTRMTNTPEFYESDPRVWQCSSSGWVDLNLTATDADMKQVWEIVSRIRKQP